MNFTEKVLRIVSNIPKGSVLTYKQVAQKAGSPRASRAVGSIMRKNKDLHVPCHRVICSDGFVGEYNRGGIRQKRRILLAEGVALQHNGTMVV